MIDERRKDTFTKSDGVSLKEHLLSRCQLYQEINDARMDAHEKAAELANDILNARLASMNEIREQLRSQKTEFVTRLEHEMIVKDIRDLREFRAALQGKASLMSVYGSYILSVIAIIVSIIHLFK